MFTLRALRAAIPFLASFQRLQRKYMRAAVRVFGTADTGPRVQALLFVRHMAASLPPPAIELAIKVGLAELSCREQPGAVSTPWTCSCHRSFSPQQADSAATSEQESGPCSAARCNEHKAFSSSACAQGVYRAFVRNAKFMTASSAPHVAFMGACVVELFGLDMAAAYEHAFVYIRELAALLRGAATNKTKDAFREVYCWQTVNTLELWAKLLAAHHDKEACRPLCCLL